MKKTPLRRKTPLKRAPFRPKPKAGAKLKRTPLRVFSKKRAAAEREYRKLKREWLPLNPFCQIGVLCGGKHRTQDVHHRAGRGPNLNRTDTWVASCRLDHDWVHQHPREARELGFLT